MNRMLEQLAQTQLDAAELNDWLESLDSVAERYDSQCVADLLHALRVRAGQLAPGLPIATATPYLNTIPAKLQPDYPGDLELEKRIRNLIRWNAMAMVSHLSAWDSIGEVHRTARHQLQSQSSPYRSVPSTS